MPGFVPSGSNITTSSEQFSAPLGLLVAGVYVAVSFSFSERALNAPAELEFVTEIGALGSPWTPSSCEEVLKACRSKFSASGSLKIG